MRLARWSNESGECTNYAAVCNVQCAICNLRCTVCSVQCAMCSVQCAVCNVQCAMSVGNALITLQCAAAGPQLTKSSSSAADKHQLDFKRVIFASGICTLVEISVTV